MDIMQQLGLCGIVPVAVIENAENAAPTASAMARGGINSIEITMRTAAALDAMEQVALNCPETIVGAGTVLNLEAEKKCLDKGAKFIVSPGFNAEMCEYSLKNNIPYLPGCVTPTEIMQALEYGLKTVKSFPANVYGGLKGMKALAAPFVGLKFMPTGGVNAENVSEYLAADFIHAVGGSWVCTKQDISAGNYDKIEALCREATTNAMGFQVVHVGINTPDEKAAEDVSRLFGDAFGFALKNGNSSIFASSGIEVMKTMFRGDNGHIAVKTVNVERAVAYLEARGFKADPSSFKFKNGVQTVAYLEANFGGFAVHLVKG